MRLKEKVIVVTGGTSGIGRGTAKILAREGAKLVIAGRNESKGHGLEQDFKEMGLEGLFVSTDVTKTEECIHLIDSTIERYGRIDGLVNNAGIFPYAPFEEMTEEMYDTVMDTNLKGAYFCTQRAVSYMKRQRCGSIVNIGSTHWQVGCEGLSAYSVSKGGLHTFTEHIAHHYAPWGIRCNWISVGWVLSDGERKRCLEAGMSEEEIQEQAKLEIPSGKFQTEEDIAYVCVFLLSEEARQVTGTDIQVTGGFRSVGRIG